MPQPLIPGPDPSRQASTNSIPLGPSDATFENDFSELAARFAAKSGGGLSQELSSDLALEIVLNEIVEQACLATGATGAAIVLPREGEMVCRATSGSTAPDLGARLDTEVGLSGECVRTRRTQRSDDVLVDSRADREASKRLGVRSVIIMPILRGVDLLGVFELFAPQPFAFGDRDEHTLEVLVERTLNNLEQAARGADSRKQSLPEPTEEPALEGRDSDNESDDGNDLPHQGWNATTWTLGFAVLACSLFLGLLLGRDLGWRNTVPQARPATLTTTAGASLPAAPQSAPLKAVPDESSNTAAVLPASARPTVKPSVNGSVPAGGMRVYENGKEVFRITPTETETEEDVPGGKSAGVGMEPAASLEPTANPRRKLSAMPAKVIELPPTAVDGALLKRVEPEYPAEARQQKIQGAVVLQLRVGVDGRVEDVQILSGPPQLYRASTDAVTRWKFKPRNINGRPVEMRTQVTINFRLPG